MSELLTDPAFVRLAGRILNGGLGGLAGRLNDGPGFLSDGKPDETYFYPGSSAADQAHGVKWRLGYASVDLTPYDYYKKEYYLGGYMTGANGFNNRID